MNKLPKEKRDKLILVIMGTLGAVGLLYTFVLSAQQDRMYTLQAQIAGVQDKLDKAERVVRSADTINEDLAASRAELQRRQADMAPQGQYYVWFLKLLDTFRKEQRLQPHFILDVTQPEFAPVGLVPQFPYQAGYFGVRVSGRFHEIGQFFASLENKYPYMRVQSVKLQPAGAGRADQQSVQGGDSGQRIIAEFKIVTLFNPGTT